MAGRLDEARETLRLRGIGGREVDREFTRFLDATFGITPSQ